LLDAEEMGSDACEGAISEKWDNSPCWQRRGICSEVCRRENWSCGQCQNLFTCRCCNDCAHEDEDGRLPHSISWSQHYLMHYKIIAYINKEAWWGSVHYLMQSLSWDVTWDQCPPAPGDWTPNSYRSNETNTYQNCQGPRARQPRALELTLTPQFRTHNSHPSPLPRCSPHVPDFWLFDFLVMLSLTV
jgi:hypothetical protein